MKKITTPYPDGLYFQGYTNKPEYFQKLNQPVRVGDLEADDSNQRGRYMTPEATLPDSAETSGDVRYTVTEMVSGLAAGGAIHCVAMLWTALCATLSHVCASSSHRGLEARIRTGQ